MIVKVTGTGPSFKGAANYYLHDKGTDTAERVAWTHTENLPTDDPDKAWKVMAYTVDHAPDLKRMAGVKSTGRKLRYPVLTMALSWHEDEAPDPSHMLETAQEAVATLGLDRHQAMYIAHRDEKHQHVHILINRVDQTNGKAANLSHSKRKLQAWALGYEKKQGVIRCPQRLQNAEKRKRNLERKPQDREVVRYGDNVIREAWEQSDSGKTFAAALEDKGYHLATGSRSRLVVVKAHGPIVNPTRELPGVKAKQFRERLADLDLSQLPDAEKVKEHVMRHRNAKYAKEMRASRTFDTWSTKLRQDTKHQHTTERRQLRDKHRQQMKAKKAEVAKYYKLRSQRAAIKKLYASLQKPSVWSKLTGKDRKDRDQLRAMIQTYRNAQGRAKEQIGALAVKQAEAVQEQKDRHQLETQQMNDSIAVRKPEMYRAPKKKTTQKKQAQSKTPKQQPSRQQPSRSRPRTRPGRGREDDDGRGRGGRGR